MRRHDVTLNLVSTRHSTADMATMKLSDELRFLEIEARRRGQEFLAHMIGVAAVEAREAEVRDQSMSGEEDLTLRTPVA